VARNGAAPSLAQAFNSARLDAFHLWSIARRDARLSASTASAGYLPRDLQMYGGTFDQNGSWQYEASHGYVWYPTVAPDWRPYSRGYWSPLPVYGWTWIGLDIWAWPTHHYGRWGHKRSRWFWIPHRTWGPAWVHWAGGPDFVGWVPLGFDNRPVFGVSLSIGHPGWVVVPRRTFGVRHAYAYKHDVWRDRGPGVASLVAQEVAPIPPPQFAARTAAVGRPAGRVAVPRASVQRVQQPQTSAGQVDVPTVDVPRVQQPGIAAPRAVPRRGSQPERRSRQRNARETCGTSPCRTAAGRSSGHRNTGETCGTSTCRTTTGRAS
jgi:hypothetical protein